MRPPPPPPPRKAERIVIRQLPPPHIEFDEHNEEIELSRIAVSDALTTLGRSPREQILAIANRYGNAGVNVNDHRFCRIVQVIAAMTEAARENLLRELRGNE